MSRRPQKLGGWEPIKDSNFGIFTNLTSFSAISSSKSQGCGLSTFMGWGCAATFPNVQALELNLQPIHWIQTKFFAVPFDQ